MCGFVEASIRQECGVIPRGSVDFGLKREIDMTESEFVATVRNGIEAYVCNETKLFKSNQGDYDFAEAVVDHLILNGNLPLEEFSAAQCLSKNVEIDRLKEKILYLDSKVRMYEVQHDLENGILHAQALSTMDGSPAPDVWKELDVVAKARPLGNGDYVSLQRLEGARNICVWMTKRSHLWTIASEFIRIDSF